MLKDATFGEKFNKKLLAIASKLGQNKLLRAIQNAYLATLLVSIIGSVFILITFIPINPWLDFINNSYIGTITIAQALMIPFNYTVGIMAVYYAFFVGYKMGVELKTDAPTSGLITLICFFMMTFGAGEFGTRYLGSRGLFTAMIVGLIVPQLYAKIVKKGWTIKLPESVPSNVSESFAALVPGAVIVVLFTIASSLFALTSFETFTQWVFGILQNALQGFIGNNVVAATFIQFINQLLWYFGLHGGNIVTSLTNPIYSANALENLTLYQAGKEPIYIISTALSRVYLSGGAGSTLGLAVLMAFVAKSKRLKSVGRLALPGTIFMINEPIVFGLPIVLNPIFAIPWLIATPIALVVSYFAMSSGLVPIPIGASVPWTCPPFLYGILQGSWKISVLELVNNILVTSIWYPFFKLYDKQCLNDETGNAKDS